MLKKVERGQLDGARGGAAQTVAPTEPAAPTPPAAVPGDLHEPASGCDPEVAVGP